MTIPTLGTLQSVDLREAWNHEAHSFTPWLAAHLNELSAQLGIPLELEGQEVAVDRFSADILARNPQDDTLVLIENQLECSDHPHLGQIMTYLAGLDAHTVVWIAADFREPHLSALKWLNEHTDDSFAFFAVKVKAVRIGDSPIAPVFDVLTRPNHWERQQRTIAQETRQMSPRGQFRKAFWTHYVTRFPDEQARGNADAAVSRWRVQQGIDLVVTIFLAQDGVGVYIRGLRGVDSKQVQDMLEPHSQYLQTVTQTDVHSPDKGHYFVSTYKGQTADKDQWDVFADWLHSTADAYEAAITELFGQQD